MHFQRSSQTYLQVNQSSDETAYPYIRQNDTHLSVKQAYKKTHVWASGGESLALTISTFVL
jgi:hypothetical protein